MQKASGASLDRIGLRPRGGSPGILIGSSTEGSAGDEELDDIPPPEYAPPRPPAQGEYVAPVRPISAYTSRPSECAITNTSTAQSPSAAPPSSPSAFDKVYLSTGQEEAQRRYEEATSRVAGSSSAAPSTPSETQAVDAGPIHSPTSPPPFVTSASSPAPSTSTPAAGITSSLSDKEQMKRYYEAQDRVARAAAQKQNGEGGIDSQAGSSGSGLGRNEGVGSSISAIGAIDEKEQMRRYYEAQEKVAAASKNDSGSDSNSNRASGDGRVPGIVSGVPNALSEKEQMRRYYEAQDRVAAAGGGASGSENRPSSLPAPATSSASHPVGVTDEKEQMRRYYEARDRVAAAAATGASGSGNGVLRTPTRHSTLSSVPTTAHADVVDEKEQMRRYYEAEDRVAKAAERRAGPASAFASGSIDDDVPPPPFEASTSSSVNEGSAGGAGHLPAGEEKALMRQRYELAQSAVRKNMSSNSIGSINSQPTPPYRSRSNLDPGSKPFVLPTSSSSVLSTSTPNGRQLSNITAATTSMPPDSPNLRDPLVKAGKARVAYGGKNDEGYVSGYAGGSGSSSGNGGESGSGGGSNANVPAGPPPPLPTKPPREYIHLLSRVGE